MHSVKNYSQQKKHGEFIFTVLFIIIFNYRYKIIIDTDYSISYSCNLYINARRLIPSAEAVWVLLF